jgi:murein DD-endopeptidase MepM/ murein hydrolase activator NlpD
MRRLHPILKIRKRHLGTDYAAPMGTPIFSVGDGVVIKAAYHRNSGKYVTIRHSKIYKSEYLHMSRIKKGIKPGVQVHRGNVIGYVGMTGLATGPHLDFRLWKNGRVFDHINQNLPVDKSLKKEYVSIFKKQTAALKARLNSIQLSSATSEPEQTATGLP